MQENFSRRELIEPSELRRLNEKSNFMGFFQLFSHFIAILLISILHYILIYSWWSLASGLALGVLINFLYAGQHELSHGTVFKTFKLNEFFGRIIGFFMLFPRDFDQIMHFAHHKWTQDWEKDGELVREPFTIKTYLLWFWGVTYWRNRIVGIFRRARGVVIEPYINPSEYKKVILESRLHVFGYLIIFILSLCFNSWAALTFWILPMLITKPIHQMQNTIEHLGLTHKKDILQNTRSTRTNFLMKWLCWQMPYHTAHHTFPSVPFWKLKELNSKIEKKSGNVYSMGYFEFQIEVIKRLWQKDESQWPMNEVWVISRKDGTEVRVPAE
jgi:fatty acid desaturase